MWCIKCIQVCKVYFARSTHCAGRVFNAPLTKALCIYFMTLFRHLILSFISLYQKYISPVKGYKCAYGSLYKNGTCSSRIYEIVKYAPLKDMRSKISSQFQACEFASKTMENDRPNRKDTEECKDKLWGAACGCFSV